MRVMSSRQLWVIWVGVWAVGSIKQVSSINDVLDIEGVFPYLINKTDKSYIEPRDYMDFENLFAPSESYKLQTNAPKRLYHLIKGFDFANYYQTDHWHYSDQRDLERSALPVANSTLCSLHLSWLELQLNSTQWSLFAPGEQHIQLMNMIDSFGKPEAETYHGRNQWMGSYEQCKRVSVDIAEYERDRCLKLEDTNCRTHVASQFGTMHTRYCIGKARDLDWPTDDDYVPKISYKIGLCLPETCETLSISRHRDQLQRLMLFSMADYLRSRISLQDLYCLPDPRSPVRELAASSRIFLTLLIVWLGSVIVCTVIYSGHKRHQRDLRNIRRLQAETHSQPRSLLVKVTAPIQGLGDEEAHSKSLFKNGANLLISRTQETIGMVPNCNFQTGNVVQADSVEPESSSSVSTGSSSLCQGSVSTDNDEDDYDCQNEPLPMAIQIARSLSIKENLRDFLKPPAMLRKDDANKKLRINLNALDAIKCICCILVIFGHIVFIHMMHLRNVVMTIDLANEVYPRFLIAFFNFVDTFFIISGMLTAYFIFKRFNKSHLASPLVWLQISFIRLIRLSPVYVLTFWFVKTLSVHLGEGPIWDYGTDKNSIKGLCMNDHWWKSILYLGNTNSMQPICILPAWSIIVDSQYSLIIPPLLFLILKQRKLGYLTLLFAIIASTIKMSIQLANQTAVKTSDMAKVRLHVYPLISRFAAEFYNSVWNRIGPVAIGIIGGHMLYLYDMKIIIRWPWFMHGLAFRFVVFMHLFICILPIIGRFTDSPESRGDVNMTIFVLSNATVKPVWSLINTIFLLRLITDLRTTSTLARLMSHNIWHGLGKLCFASYLIHYEIILLLLKSRPDGLPAPNWSNAMREFSFAFMISTLLAYLIYILYEAPINKLSALLMAKSRPPIQGQQVSRLAQESEVEAKEPLDFVKAEQEGLVDIRSAVMQNKPAQILDLPRANDKSNGSSLKATVR